MKIFILFVISFVWVFYCPGTIRYFRRSRPAKLIYFGNYLKYFNRRRYHAVKIDREAAAPIPNKKFEI